MRREWIWLNPASNASPPRTPPAEISPPAPAQVTWVLKRVDRDDRDLGTFIWLAAVTGARRSRLLGLRWAEVDLTDSAIGFSRAFVEGPHGPVLRATKTHRTYRVAIDDETAARLKRDTIVEPSDVPSSTELCWQPEVSCFLRSRLDSAVATELGDEAVPRRTSATDRLRRSWRSLG